MLKQWVERCLRAPPREQADGSMLCRFSFPASEPVFAGHFPGRPVVPGVFQVEMVRVAAERACGEAFCIVEVSKAKFARVILPDEEVLLSLRLSPGDGVRIAKASMSVAGERAGEVRLLLSGITG